MMNSISDVLTTKQRETVFAAFGPEPDMQLYERGIRQTARAHAAGRPPPAGTRLQPDDDAAGHAGDSLWR